MLVHVSENLGSQYRRVLIAQATCNACIQSENEKKCDGQCLMLFIGAELNVGDELDSPVILEHNIF